MNRTLLACLLLVCTLTGLAQNKVALESGTTTTFHNTVEAAVAAAQPGDVIQVPGGVWVSSSLTVDKSLTIIGVGFHPDSTLATGPTIFQGAVQLANGASNTVFIGIRFSSCVAAMGYTGPVYATVNNIAFIRCHLYDFDGASCSSSFNVSNFSNLLFEGSILDQSIDLDGATNARFRACFLNSAGCTNCKGTFEVEQSIVYLTAAFSFANGLFRNNVFIGNVTGTYFSDVVAQSSLIMMNNVFEDPAPGPGISSGFDVLQSTNNNYGAAPATVFQSFTGTTFSFANNYHLASGSPALGAGYGGTDCGIYGGPNPWKEGAVPPNPHISFQSIGSTTNGQGQLPATIKVTAQDR